MSKYTISEQYETMCREMVGKRYNKLVVAEYLGIIDFNNRKRKSKERAVKCYCDCGRELIVSAMQIRKGYVKSCSECSDRKWGNTNLCCDCRKATNMRLCSWAAGIPRDDWDAQPCITGGLKTYKINSCPGFEK